MEPFEYDDYSEFDTEELDFELPPRKSTFRSSRHASPFELEIDDQEIERLRSRVRQVTSDFLDSCDSTRNKAKKKDEAALKQIDMAMVFTSRYHAGSLPPPSSRKTGTEAMPEVDPQEKRSTRRKMREIESRLDGILDYEAKSASGFKEMRSALQDIQDKMAKHRLLIDRYSGLDMKEGNGAVKDRVESKVEELVPRLPCLTSVQRSYGAGNDAVLNDFDPRLVPGYSTGLCITKDDRNSELRGRIRSLLCRTRESSRKDAKNPHLKPPTTRRREVTVE